MTQEEKAKAYDEAIERAKEVYDAYRFSMDMSNFNPTDIEYIFPQLAESEDERIRNEILIYIGARQDIDLETHNRWCAYLENQKPSFRQIHDSAIWDNGLRTGVELDLNQLEKQKEEAGYEEIPVESTPEYKLGFKAGKESEKQKEQQPIEMEVYEVGKGTTIYGQDYKCKKDYKEGDCWFIKDVIYHCRMDGYLTDQNGISWYCTPKWFNEYIYTNNELADKEKTDFVSGQFLQCKLSFDDFKEGEHYWLEYVGDDTYVGRSDNILNQKFHITPRQLFTLFSQQLDEKQKEQKPLKVGENAYFDPNTDMWFIKKEQNARRVERYHELVFRDICKHLKKEGYDGWVLLLNALRNGEFKQPVTEWSEEDERIRKELIGMVKFHCADEHLGRYLNWLENRVKFLRPQPKQELSEEDKNVIETLIRELRLNAQFEFAVRKLGLDYIQTLAVLDKCRRLCPCSSWKPGEQKYDGNMDKECIKLCDVLNSVPSIDTFESCCGHLKDRYSIWFFCNDIITISRLGRCVERNYSDGKWELLVDSTDTHPTGVFWLRSKEPFQSYDEMEESVNELCNCIQYWFNTEFDSYFNCNACEETTKKEEHWKPSEQEKGALRTAIHILTDERSFPKAAAHLQDILNAFEGKESRKDWKPSEEQMEAFKNSVEHIPNAYYDDMWELYEQLKKLI